MTIEMEIRVEIYRSLEKVGADRRLLAIIGSWGDTLEDAEVLDCSRNGMPTAKSKTVL